MQLKKKVLIVDDSALVRKKVGGLIEQLGYEPDFARNGKEALAKLFSQNTKYALVTLDINMPVMDGLSALKEIMRNDPMPVLMVSSLTDGESDTTFEALQEGAVDFVPKPGTFSVNLDDDGKELQEKVKSAIRIPRKKLFLKRKSRKKLRDLEGLKQQAKDTIKTANVGISSTEFTKLVAIGASTGGPKLIEQIATLLPANYPYPVLVAQHMPASFTQGFAKRLDRKSDLTVVESSHNMVLEPGMFVVAKGGQHSIMGQKASGRYIIKLQENIQNHFFVPSINELFDSINKSFQAGKVMAVELTGIGTDGAKGLLELKKKGAYTLAQSQSSATVYGMPKEAVRIDAATKQMDFEQILQEVLEFGKG